MSSLNTDLRYKKPRSPPDAHRTPTAEGAHHPPPAFASHRQRQPTERRKELRLGSPLLGHGSTRYACNGLAHSRWAAELVRNFDKDTEQREPAEGPVEEPAR